MSREAKHLRLPETHQIAKTQTTFFGRTNNTPQSKTPAAPQNAPKQTPQLHLLDKQTMPREAKHLRPRDAQQIATIKITYLVCSFEKIHMLGTIERARSRQANNFVAQAKVMLRQALCCVTGIV